MHSKYRRQEGDCPVLLSSPSASASASASAYIAFSHVCNHTLLENIEEWERGSVFRTFPFAPKGNVQNQNGTEEQNVSDTIHLAKEKTSDQLFWHIRNLGGNVNGKERRVWV